MLPVVLWLVWLGGLPFIGLITVVAGICGFEFAGMAFKNGPWPHRIAVTVLSAALPLGASLGWLANPSYVIAAAAGTAVLFLVLTLFTVEGDDLTHVPARAGLGVLGVLYVGGLFSIVAQLRQAGMWTLVLLMAITWLNDTGAYFAGRAFGKHKLAPRVSPAKTWEGFFGGLFSSVAGAVTVKALVPYLPLDGAGLALSYLDVLAIGLLAGGLGPAGDLCESMFKRAFGVKDSGNTIPGHGGFLDRVDALLFNAFAVAAWVWWVAPALA